MRLENTKTVIISLRILKFWRGVYLKLGVVSPLQTQDIRQKWPIRKRARFPRHRDAAAVYHRRSYNYRC